jgi:hypothetical protein
MRRVLLLAATLALVGCSEPEPVAVPDLLGMQLDAAREIAEDFELEEVDASGTGRGVWSPSNWIVEEQDPSAGEPVEPGSTVTVQIVNVRDEDEQQEDEDERPADADPEDADPEDEQPEAADPEDPPAERPDTDIEADVIAGSAGLTIRPERGWGDCRLNLNGGLIRSGYTARIAQLPAGEDTLVPYSELTDRDGRRFDDSATRPERFELDCREGDDAPHGFGYWEW